MVITMTSYVEIPEDRTYETKMLINADLSGSVVLDFVDPRTFDSRVAVYLSNQDVVDLLEWIQVNAGVLKEKQSKMEYLGKGSDDSGPGQ